MGDDSGPRAVEVTVTGRVQGVYFRAGCAQQAHRSGVSGWVRNEPDGTVRGHFEGTGSAVDDLVAWCHRGTPHAEVTAVRVEAVTPHGLVGFDAG